MEQKINKKKMYIILSILGGILLLSGVSYAILTLLITGTVENIIHSGNLALTLDETQNINMTSVVPITDEEGMLGDAYVFTVENTGTIEAGYTIYLEDNTLEAGETQVPGASIRYELKVNGTCSDMGNLSDGSTTLFIDNIKPGTITNFELRLWIDYDVTSLPNNGVHRSSLRIEASQGLLDVSSGVCSTGKNDGPVLANELIPVTYGASGEVYKADTTSEWYNYDESMWANAVTVSEGNRNNYINATPGIEINMDDIDQMFVWIPRYSYDPASIINSETAFDISFVSVNEDAHLAFCWGNSCKTDRSNPENIELTGIWVGKFETGYKTGEDYETENVSIVTKPNVFSIGSMSGADAFDKAGNIIVPGGDVHRMKNIDWGAIAYLSQSKYGLCNNDGTCNKRVSSNGYRGNNSSSYWSVITGCGSLLDEDSSGELCPINNRWNSANGMLSSTTHNMYGVYDMNAGRYDIMMANVSHIPGEFNVAQTQFAEIPEPKYYDLYDYYDMSKFEEMHTKIGFPGDATYELHPIDEKVPNFYNYDYSYTFPLSISGGQSWFSRLDLFSVTRAAGSSVNSETFRTTLIFE